MMPLRGAIRYSYPQNSSESWAICPALRQSDRKEFQLTVECGSQIDIINLMGSAKHKKSYEVSREGWITVYPSLHENKEKGTFRRILKRLIQLKKGH